MTAITVTLRQILAAKPCYDPRDKGLLPADHDLDAPISFREIAKKAGPNDLIWCFAYALPGHEALKRHFAVDCAERVKHLMTDARSLDALAVARRHAMGEATDAELAAALAAARVAARVAAWDAAGAAARAAARVAAWDAAGAAARAAERAWQDKRIIQLTEAGEWAPAGDE